MGERLILLIPNLHTVSENHRYRRRREAIRAVRVERDLAYTLLRAEVGAAWAVAHRDEPITVILTRLAPRRLDPLDGLPSALKHVRDGVAAFLAQCLPAQGGQVDAQPRFTWHYAQGPPLQPRTWAIQIELVLGTLPASF